MRLALRSSRAVYCGLLDMPTSMRSTVRGARAGRDASRRDDLLARAVDRAGDLAQRELAQRRQVLLGEEVASAVGTLSGA